MPWNVSHATLIPFGFGDHKTKHRMPVLTWLTPADSPRDCGRNTKGSAPKYQALPPQNYKKGLKTQSNSTEAPWNWFKRCFVKTIWVICFIPCFLGMVEVWSCFLSSWFLTHSKPRKPYESQLSRSSFARDVEHQNSSHKIIIFYIITQHSSVDCPWMCKRKSRAQHLIPICSAFLACAVSLWHLKEWEERATERALHRVEWAESGAAEQQTIWARPVHTTGTGSGVTLGVNQVLACLKPVHYCAFSEATQHHEPESQCWSLGEHRSCTYKLK